MNAPNDVKRCPTCREQLDASGACRTMFCVGVGVDGVLEGNPVTRRDGRTVPPATNCPHKERVTIGVDVVDGAGGRPELVSKGMRCTACGDIAPATVLVASPPGQQWTIRPPNCPHVAYGYPACEACTGVPTDVGGDRARALELAWKLRELVHALATCTHKLTRLGERNYCGRCGSKFELEVRSPNATPVWVWRMPELVDAAKALDLEMNSGATTFAEVPDDSSEKKRS